MRNIAHIMVVASVFPTILVANAQVSFTEQILQAPSTFGATSFGDEIAIGDVNGDGILDLAGGAPKSHFFNGGGRLYLGPGFDTGSWFTAPGLVSGDWFGLGAWVLSDVNGDGNSDLVGGAALSHAGTTYATVGRCFLLYGPDLTSGLELKGPLPSVQFQTFGLYGAVGDLGNDGSIEVIIGAPYYPPKGRIHVYSGSSFLTGLPSAVLEPQNPFVIGGTYGPQWGVGMLIADHDGNGLNDILTPQIAPPPAPNPGVLGWIEGGNQSVVTMVGPSGFQIGNLDGQLEFEDMNKDGHRDILAAGDYADAPGMGYRAIVIWYGPGFTATNDVWELVPTEEGRFGEDFDIGDVNRDGWLDIVGGAAEAKVGTTNWAGQVSILYGPNYTTGQVLNGSVYSGFFGEAVEVVDLDDDGFAEVFVGEPFYSTGRVHIYRHRTLRVTGSSTISLATGGTATLALECGKLSASQSYLVLSSISGSEPGTTIPSGAGSFHLPLTLDAFTFLALGAVNTPAFTNFAGVLNSEGKAEAKLIVPSGLSDPALNGLVLTFAGVTHLPSGAIQYTTHAATVTLGS
jgi:FG-GAP repeat